MAKTNRPQALPRGAFLEWLRQLTEDETTRVPDQFVSQFGARWISTVVAQKTRSRTDAAWRWRVEGTNVTKTKREAVRA